MHVLFLSHYFPPEVNAPASRTFEHCRQWVEDGDHVTVLTCFPNHPAGRIYPGFRNRLYQKDTDSGIQIVRLLTYVTPNEGFIKRSANYIFFMLVSIVASFFVRRVDVVVTTSPQFFNGIAGYFVSRIKRTPWVLEIRDLWPESILALGAIQNKWLIRCLQSLAEFAYRKADHVVVVTDAFKDHLEGLGIESGKITVLKNGVDLTLFTAAPRDDAVAASIGLGGRFLVSYVGTHGMAHGLETILEAAQILRDRDDIGFLLVGDGAARAELLASHAARGLTNVVMLGQLERSLMPSIWSASDACLVVLRDKPVFRTVIPSKIFEVMAMRKPIILGVAGESQEIVQKAGAGLCVAPENAQALAEAVVALCNNRTLAASLGSSGFDYVTKHHDRVNLARRYATLMKDVAMERRPAQFADQLPTD